MLSRPVDEIPHDEQVAGNVHVADAVQLLIDAIAHLRPALRIRKLLVGIAPFETLPAKMNQVGVRIAAFAAKLVAFHDLLDRFPVFGGKGFDSLVLVPFQVLLRGLFERARIFLREFLVHHPIDFSIFLGFQKLLRNLVARPEIVADARLHLETATQGDFFRIVDRFRKIRKKGAHFGFGTEIELVRRKPLVDKFLELLDQGDAAQGLVRPGIFALDVVNVANRDQLARKLLRERYGKQVQRLLESDSVIADRKIQMVMVENPVERLDIRPGLGFATRYGI